MRALLRLFLIAAITLSSLFGLAAAAPIHAQSDSPKVPTWLDTSPVARFRTQADWLVDMGLLSKEDAYGPFKTKEYSEGDTERFTALDFLARGPARKLTATLELVTEHAYWWFEEGAEVDKDKLIEAGKRFENDIYPLDTKLYGNEWSPGIDGDPHIFILHQKKIGGYAVGVFSLRDECPAELCRDSNQREMIYIGLDYGPVGSTQQLSVISHEFQHLIQFNVDGDEQRWMDEGLAQLAEHLNGFNPREISGGAVRGYLAKPNFQINGWPASPADNPSTNYGVSYLFCLYLYQRFGTPFIQALARSKQKGLASVEHTLADLKLGTTLDQVFVDWTLANYLNSPYVGDGRYYYQSFKLPIKPSADTLAPNDTRRVNLQNYGTQYYLIKNAGEYTLSFRGERSAKLGPSQAASGDYMWWSYNESRGAARLEREIDLSNAKEARLEYKLWMDVSTEGDDYGHIMVSDDNGEKWDILRGRYTKRCSTTRTTCYEGKTSGWVDEAVDLTPYLGKNVRIRFEYLTQAGDLTPGIFLDDIQVKTIDFKDDVETLDAGWTAQGFMRVPATVPWHWAVNVIDRSDPATITPMTIPETNSATLKVKVGKNGAVVVVDGMAPFIFGSANFSLSARQ
jgi:hypothetical protein